MSPCSTDSLLERAARRGSLCRRRLAADQQGAIVLFAADRVVAAAPAYLAGLDEARLPTVQVAAALDHVPLGPIGEKGRMLAAASDQRQRAQRTHYSCHPKTTLLHIGLLFC